jgi:hypothetical protein
MEVRETAKTLVTTQVQCWCVYCRLFSFVEARSSLLLLLQEVSCRSCFRRRTFSFLIVPHVVVSAGTNDRQKLLRETSPKEPRLP